MLCRASQHMLCMQVLMALLVKDSEAFLKSIAAFHVSAPLSRHPCSAGMWAQSPPVVAAGRVNRCADWQGLAMKAGGGDDWWMFVDAKGFNKGGAALGELEVGVLVKPFGMQMVMGDEHWIDVSKPSEQLLIQQAHQQGKRLAYTIGRASTSGTFANAQGFLSGTPASLLSVRQVRRTPDDMGVSCLVRVEGRVVLKSVKSTNPSIVAVAMILRDLLPETPSRCGFRATSRFYLARMYIFNSLSRAGGSTLKR